MPKFTKFKPNVADYGDDVSVYLMDAIPKRLRREVFSSFAKGFNDCLYAIAACLNQNRAPTVANVSYFWHMGHYDARYREFYEKKGGKIIYGIRAILNRSEDEHETLGDGSFLETPEFKAAIDALPKHPKDDDYAFILSQLDDDEDEEEDDEDDEEDEEDTSNSHEWPQVERCDWGYVYISSHERFGYYDDEEYDDEDDKEEEEEEGVNDPLCIVYLGAPLMSKSVTVRLSVLQKPPFEGKFASLL